MQTAAIYLHQLPVALSLVTLLVIQSQITDVALNVYLIHGQLLTTIITANACQL